MLSYLSENNHVVLADDFFQLGQTEEKEFYSLETEKSDFTFSQSDNNYLYASILIQIDAREDTYERTVLSVFDFTGLIGGVFEILEIFGGMLVGFFANKLFMLLMLSNLYQIQIIHEHDSEFNDSNHNRKRNIKSTVRNNMNEETKYKTGKIKMIRVLIY